MTRERLTYDARHDHRGLWWEQHEILAEVEGGPSGTIRGLDALDSGWRELVDQLNAEGDRQLASNRRRQRRAPALAVVGAHHRIAVHARLALDDRQARDRAARDRFEVTEDVRTAADWAQVASNHVPYAELQRRRGVAQ